MVRLSYTGSHPDGVALMEQASAIKHREGLISAVGWLELCGIPFELAAAALGRVPTKGAGLSRGLVHTTSLAGAVGSEAPRTFYTAGSQKLADGVAFQPRPPRHD